MLPITREVETTYDGPTVACPSCDARIAISSPTGWSIRSPQDVHTHLGLELAALEREELRILLLNTKNVVLRVVTIYVGNVSASVVRVGELFREAVRDNVASVILIHNHPSGDLTPSPDDLHLTAAAQAAGRLLDIHVLDHIVVGSGGYESARPRRHLRPMSPNRSVPPIDPDWLVALFWAIPALVLAGLYLVLALAISPLLVPYVVVRRVRGADAANRFAEAVVTLLVVLVCGY